MPQSPFQPHITPDMLLRAYAIGVFPMAESADDPTMHWIEPRTRCIFPLNAFHVPKKLARLVRSDRFDVRVDTDFESVIAACAAPAGGRETTWINTPIRQLYGALFRQGHCRTVEVYQDGALVGGLYGVDLGGAFFGESMFHRATDASKVALVHLVGRLIAGGYALLDAQFITPHLATFGARELPRAQYRKVLADALAHPADFRRAGDAFRGEDALRAIRSIAESAA